MRSNAEELKARQAPFLNPNQPETTGWLGINPRKRELFAANHFEMTTYGEADDLVVPLNPYLKGEAAARLLQDELVVNVAEIICECEEGEEEVVAVALEMLSAYVDQWPKDDDMVIDLTLDEWLGDQRFNLLTEGYHDLEILADYLIEHARETGVFLQETYHTVLAYLLERRENERTTW